ncbi:hypothetical protein ANANG_G00004900 [Anguilla anguilla]|uniref:Uncharacterized protein n=1 Tax=Anguilla anguilla TaxID=7936 RepID=A0A9D3MVQ0_ANGAN|nr:hypothetical protein ANANG_G00004900 [Anguilla anguilla]
MPLAAHTQEPIQEAIPPAAIVTVAMVTVPNDTAEVTQPVEEQTPPTCPVEPGPANQEAESMCSHDLVHPSADGASWRVHRSPHPEKQAQACYSFIFAKSPEGRHRDALVARGAGGAEGGSRGRAGAGHRSRQNAKVPPPVAKKPAQHADQAPPPDQTATENGGVAAPAEETPGALPKENPESSNPKPAGGAQPASTDQVTLSPPP